MKVLSWPWCAGALSYMGLIWFLSSRSLEGLSPMIFPHADKVIHFFEFGFLAYLWVKSLKNEFWLMSWSLSVAWGLIDEWHQYYVPGRSSSVGDAMFDVLGVTLVLFFVRKNQGNYLKNAEVTIDVIPSKARDLHSK